ncbi:MAG: DNA polymerase III subunit gamma/tau, partial [Oscillospiraceae bacterium]
KWRPLTFDDVVGLEHITETLKNQVKNDRLSHAYLFVGTHGTGKTTCAKILSRAVNCEHPVNGNPCNKCRSCLGILDGSIMDVEEMDAASNNGVDNVRALRDEAIFSPASVKKRVYIIDEVHMLSASAFNALLKILEEPPEHLMFILATTELHKVPATILSRCQRYSFRRIDGAAISNRLQTIARGEGITLTGEAAGVLSRLSEGSMRDAVSLLDQCAGREEITADDVLTAMGLAGNRRTAELLQFIESGDTQGAMACFTRLWMDGKEPETLLDELASLYRDVLMSKIAPKGSTDLLTGGYDPKLLVTLGDKLSNAALLNDLGTVQKAQIEIKDSLSPRVTAEMCIVTLCSPALSEDIASLNARVASLETKVAGEVPAAMPKNAPKSEFRPPKAMPEPAAVPKPVDEVPPWADEPADLPAVENAPTAETEPEHAAVPDPAPKPEPEKAMVYDGALWKKILESLKKSLPFGVYNIISDPFHAEGVIENGELVLYIKNGFAANMLKTSVVLDQLKLALQNTGAGKIVKIEEGNPPAQNSEPKANKIDNLMKFGNVKFK